MKIESNLIHIVSLINVTKIVSQRAERAGPGRKKVGPCAPLVWTFHSYILLISLLILPIAMINK